MRDITKRAIIFSSICGIVLALLMYALRLTVISGPSMEPTLSPGNVAVIGRTITNPEPGDIVLIDKEGRLIIKRVVAIEGQEVSLPDDPVYTGPYGEARNGRQRYFVIDMNCVPISGQIEAGGTAWIILFLGSVN